MVHPLKLINIKAKEFDKEETTEICYQWLGDFANEECATVYGYRIKCTCLKFLKEPENDEVRREVTNYLIAWAGFPN